ncbi:hypothetical protein T01_5928 [Trichinella spiralis]|uniref:Uncharacterized protein n=1 Tax=Trichinella spiralis TaxID=6334 RepID=A0A0V1BHZ2_TRISP|nr:hypothetical protein T01_5928 [Trichinella spiralis]
MFVEGLYLLVNVPFSFQTQNINYIMCAIIGREIPMLLMIILSFIRKKFHMTGVGTNLPKQIHIFLKPTVFILIGIVIAVLFCFSYGKVLFCIKMSYSQFMEKWRPRQYNCYIELFDSLSEGIKECSC